MAEAINADPVEGQPGRLGSEPTAPAFMYLLCTYDDTTNANDTQPSKDRVLRSRHIAA